MCGSIWLFVEFLVDVVQDGTSGSKADEFVGGVVFIAKRAHLIMMGCVSVEVCVSRTSRADATHSYRYC